MDHDLDYREVAINSATVFLSIALFVAALETVLVLDVVEHQKEFPKVEDCTDGDHERLVSAELNWRFHDQYGWTGVPGSASVVRQTVNEDRDLYSHNADGWRDNYDLGNRNAIVLGDSYTYGVLADDNTTYEQRLDRWTSEMAFHNYAMGGYSTANQYEIYRDVADEMSHDVVIVGYATNDPQFNTGGNDPLKPQFSLSDGELVQTKQPNYDAFLQEANAESGGSGQFGGPLVEPVQALLRENTETYSFLAPKLKATLRATGVISSPEPPQPPSGEKLDRQMNVTRALLSNIGETAARHDATVVIVYISPVGEVNPERPSRYRPEYGRPFFERQQRALREVARNHSNVQVLNLKSVLRSEINDGNQMYGTYDAHLNEAGYNVTASAIYRKLHNIGVVDKPLGDVAHDIPEASTCAGE